MDSFPEPVTNRTVQSVVDLTIDDLMALIETSRGEGKFEAVRLYREWIEANPKSPHLAVAWFNLGVESTRDKDEVAAAHAYQMALGLGNGLYQAALNLGLLHERAGAPGTALKIWQGALQPNEARVALLNQNARLLEQIGQLEVAESVLTSSIATSPDQPDAIQHWVHLRQQMCIWPVLPRAFGFRESQLLNYAGPLAALAITDSIETQKAITSGWIDRKTEKVALRLSPIKGYGHEKLRIGYMSSDFGMHAMGYLIADLFSHHDRSRFVIYGYCLGRDDGSALRKRIVESFDIFLSLKEHSDEDAARQVAADEIDVLVDLNGLTRGARPQILRWRPAPVQATYLGYIGPVPIPELDYLLCDNYVVPEASASLYKPKPLYIGPIYQVNDARREIAASASRSAVGLPECVFVYCNFSNHYKITQTIFSSWMEILRRVPNSIIWLMEDNQWSRQNLLIEADNAGVNPGRLVFSARVDPTLYMTRLSLADLYLDTFPYNSGTVASDALRMSLPLLTLRGESFASRMASRLLYAMRAELGIAENLRAYVETAVLLGTQQEIYARYKSNFTTEKWQQRIGDIQEFTHNLEKTFLDVSVL